MFGFGVNDREDIGRSIRVVIVGTDRGCLCVCDFICDEGGRLGDGRLEQSHGCDSVQTKGQKD